MDFGFDDNWASASEPIDSLFDSNDPEYKEWITTYLKAEKQTVAYLQEALEKNDYLTIAYKADMLYGHGKSVGFPLISIIGKAMVSAAESKNALQISTLITYLGKYVDFLFSQQ